MFKKLRDRLAEEANRLPVGPIAFGNNATKLPDEANKTMVTEDLITLSDSSAVITPHPIAHQFSITEDDDSCLSEQSSPLKKLEYNLDEQRSPDGHTVCHTDNESEAENPPTLNLDEISKEQLLSAIQTQKARVYKYKNKYLELKKTHTFMSEDKNKIERALVENQDKNLRRIGELREQYQLEQKAKADLEENLRVILEEKDSMIYVLQTKIDLLLKECQYPLNNNASQIKHGDSLSDEDSEIVMSEKEDDKKIISRYEATFADLKKQLHELQQQQEDSGMAMAETKKNMHLELELKELQLTEKKEEARKLQSALDHEKTVIQRIQRDQEQKVMDLQAQLEKLEQSLEDEKQNLMNEFSRGKAEAITLIQAEHCKKLASLEDGWKAKLEASGMKNEQKQIESEEELSSLKAKIIDLESNLKKVQAEKKSATQQLQDMHNQKSELSSLKGNIMELKSNLEKLRAEKENATQQLLDTQNQEAELSSLRGKFNDLESYVKKLQDERDSETQQLLNMQNQETEQTNVDLQKNIILLKEQNVHLTEENHSLKSKIQEKTTHIENIAGELSELRNHTLCQTENLTKESADSKKQCSALESKLAGSKKECSALNSKLVESKNQYSALESKLADNKKQYSALDLKLTDSKKECSALNSKLAESKNQYSALESKSADNKKQCSALNSKLVDIKKQFSTLESELAGSKKQYSALELKLEDNKKQCSVLELELADSKKQYSALESKLVDQATFHNKSVLESADAIASLIKEKEDFVRKIKMLEAEREKLMLQAQERISSAEMKHREDISQLETKLQEFDMINLEIDKLRKENAHLVTQLDSAVATANSDKEQASSEFQQLSTQYSKVVAELQSAMQGLEKQQEEMHTLQTQCDEILDKSALQIEEHTVKITTQQRKVVEMQAEVDSMQVLKKENEELQEQLISMEEKALHNENDENLVDAERLCEENKQLNEKIGCLEHSIVELTEKLQQLELDNEQLRTCAIQENSVSLTDEQTGEQNQVTSELSLGQSLQQLQNSEYEDIVMKLKAVITKLPYQIKNSDLDWDQIFTELIEMIRDQENDLRRGFQVEIAALRQDIFEKDSALEEMHEHYEEIIKEKSSKLTKYEAELKSVHESTNRMGSSNMGLTEASDWDDAWYLPEENCGSASPAHTTKPDCDVHTVQIESLEKELAKCNSELKDLRILLRLTPPHSLQPSVSQPIQVLEATEFEYLRNILYQYMLGKETVTLIKVIAAVLKFDEKQTRLIIERESLKNVKTPP